MFRRLFALASTLSLLLFVTVVVLWVRGQWTFTRIIHTHVVDTSGQFKQRRVAFLMWRDAAGMMVQTEVFHSDDKAARARLRRDLPQAPHTVVYERAGWSTEAGGTPDAAEHWGFWYRSPEASRRATLEVSFAKLVDGAEYTVTTESERAFFLPWWFLAIVLGCLPCIVLLHRVRRGLRLRAGCCPSRAYDLRATPDRCPERGRQPCDIQCRYARDKTRH